MSYKKKERKEDNEATWDDSDENELDDDIQREVANKFFMAINNDVKSLELDNDLIDDEINDEKPFYDELLNDFNDLHEKYEKLTLKNCALEMEVLRDKRAKRIFKKKKKIEIDLSSMCYFEN